MKQSFRNWHGYLAVLLFLIQYPGVVFGQVIPAQNLEVEKAEPFARHTISLSKVGGNIAWRPIVWGPAGVVRNLQDFVYVKETQRRKRRQIGVDGELRYVKGNRELLLWEGRVSGAPKLRWSKAGDKIAFIGFVNNKSGIVVYDLERGENHFITPPKGVLISHSWAWSPEGTQIAFTEKRRVPDTRYPGGKRDEYYVYTCNYDGSNYQIIGRGSVEVWSPTDSKLLVLRGEEVSSENYLGLRVDHYLWLIDMVKGSERKLLPLLYVAGGPLLSPTGLKFYFNIRGSHDVNVFDIEQDQYLSVNLDFDNSRHTWSPNGTKIAFTGFELRKIGEVPEEKIVNSDIWVVNADGTGLTQLTHTGEGTLENHPRWINNNVIIVEQEIYGSSNKTVVLTLRGKP